MHMIFLDFATLSSFDDILPEAEPPTRLLITHLGGYMQVHVIMCAHFQVSFKVEVLEGLIQSPSLTVANSVLHAGAGIAKTRAAQCHLPNFT